MRAYTWIIFLGAISALFMIATAYTGNMRYDIDIHKTLAGIAVISGGLHVGMIVYQRNLRKRK